MTLEEKMNELAKEKMAEGKEIGIKEGIKENSLSVAKLMKEKNYDIKDIIEITHLTKEEIESL